VENKAIILEIIKARETIIRLRVLKRLKEFRKLKGTQKNV